MKRILGSVVLAFTVSLAQAEVVIETVTVGNPGNPNDTHGDGYGGVAYTYQIGKYEVTNAQYTQLLNAVAAADPYGLYETSMHSAIRGGITRTGSSDSYNYTVKSGCENMPVVYVCWYDALRFANWLSNGQGSGDTETGTYLITNGSKNWGTVAIPDHSGLSGGKWFLPTENEWYKAAYYDPDKSDGAGYWDYATRTDTRPYSDNPTSLEFPFNSVNYFRNDNEVNGYDDGYAVAGSPVEENLNYLTNVGAYGLSPSAYGTFDQNGNVREWNEDVIIGDGDPDSYRVVRGGYWGEGFGDLLASKRWLYRVVTSESTFESTYLGSAWQVPLLDLMLSYPNQQRS